jgi:hypothetical protein
MRAIGIGGSYATTSRIQPQQLQRPPHADDPLIREFAKEMYHAHPTLKARRNGFSLEDFQDTILTVWKVPDFGVDVTEAVGDRDNAYVEIVKVHYERLKQLADKTRLDQFVELFHLVVEPAAQGPAKRRSTVMFSPRVYYDRSMDEDGQEVQEDLPHREVKRRRILPEGQSLATGTENLKSALPANPSKEELLFVVPTRDDQPCSSVGIEDLIHPDSNNTAPTRVCNLFH